ncbi:MAG: hypothetical protein J0H79_04695 [Alphaproteobacteria bacterium]|nr:hypothetical protein [Alphaproteobacteria bacterium]
MQRPDRYYIGSRGMGTMGFALSIAVAIGAKVAQSER